MAKHIALVISGGIAAYKAVDLMRILQKAGHEVRVCMTREATDFVGPMTFEALSGYPVLLDLFERDQRADSPIAHIDLADWADVCLVVPATANIMAKMAAGIADDAATSALLAMYCPVVVAPAMNTHMLENPATQKNLATLKSHGVHIVDSSQGLLACGYVGKGKLADINSIANYTLELLNHEKDERAYGKSLLIDAGPTREAIDPVRYLANASTGKMGYSIAKAAVDMGFEHVFLVSGPTSLDAASHVELTKVTSAAEMHEAMLAKQQEADIIICAAAVADYRPKFAADHKLKKGIDDLQQIELVKNPDILADLVLARKKKQVIVGFAAETNNLIDYAQQKLAKKGADLIVANDVSRKDSTFGADTSKISLVSKDAVVQHETLPLQEVSKLILSAALEKLVY